jgi:hypothetical protein
VICLAVALTVFIVLSILVTNESEIVGIDFGTFDVDTTPTEIITDSTGTVNIDGVTVGVSSCRTWDDKVVVLIYGENTGDEKVEWNESDFVLSVLNKSSAEQRTHYYSEENETVSVRPHDTFSADLVYKIKDAETMMPDGYVFTLSVFRANYHSEAEIVLNL